MDTLSSAAVTGQRGGHPPGTTAQEIATRPRHMELAAILLLICCLVCFVLLIASIPQCIRECRKASGTVPRVAPEKGVDMPKDDSSDSDSDSESDNDEEKQNAEPPSNEDLPAPPEPAGASEFVEGAEPVDPAPAPAGMAEFAPTLQGSPKLVPRKLIPLKDAPIPPPVPSSKLGKARGMLLDSFPVPTDGLTRAQRALRACVRRPRAEELDPTHAERGRSLFVTLLHDLPGVEITMRCIQERVDVVLREGAEYRFLTTIPHDDPPGSPRFTLWSGLPWVLADAMGQRLLEICFQRDVERALLSDLFAAMGAPCPQPCLAKAPPSDTTEPKAEAAEGAVADEAAGEVAEVLERLVAQVAHEPDAEVAQVLEGLVARVADQAAAADQTPRLRPDSTSPETAAEEDEESGAAASAEEPTTPAKALRKPSEHSLSPENPVTTRTPKAEVEPTDAEQREAPGVSSE